MAQLRCSDVTLGYEGTAVMEHLSFSVSAGDYLYIVGENGSGKSTLMKAILGLKSPMAGKIETGDGLKPDEIGYLPQQTAVQRDFPASVLEIVRSGCLNRSGLRPFYTRQEKQLALDNMERLGITHLAKRCYRELSGGQQQRVLLARALGATQKMLVLDEPVTGLDPKAQTELYELIAKLNREDGITIPRHGGGCQICVPCAAHQQDAAVFRHKGRLSPEQDRTGIHRRCTGMSIWEELTGYLSFSFVQYALIAGVLIALCSSLLGVTLVLKRFSVIGDGLSHVAFGALAIATVLRLSNSMLLVMPVTVACAVILLCANQSAKIKGDAAIAMLSVSALALGYLVQNLFSSSANISGDVCSTLFGSTLILTLSTTDVWVCVGMSIVVMAIFLLFYHKIFAVTFDETFAAATGIRARMYNLLIAVVTAVIIVLAMNLVGSLLTSALIVFPALSAMRLFRSFRGVICCAGVISVVCAVAGLLISILASTPVGATVVIADLVVFLGCSAVGALVRR